MNIKIAPSILSADFKNLGKEVESLCQAGADWIHVDVMDGNFVPNLSFGAPIIKAVRPCTNKPFDVHLMVQKPLELLDDYIDAGANQITIHAESDFQGKTLEEAILYVKSKGVDVGVSLKPATPLSVVENVLQHINTLLIMTVEPGFGGQSFMVKQVSKINQAKLLLQSINSTAVIQVDGGINAETIASCAQAGATVFVAGSAVMNGDRSVQTYQQNIKILRQKAEN